ncbi:MAG: hypothetical protein HY600_06815 [Candidatus Omnitrophica bacterium]|nr:hypothetical protein [Candidatus Omnitrophota bacterium]
MTLAVCHIPEARAVDVDPLRLELTGAPGEVVTGALTVTNHRAEPVRVAARPGPYRYAFTTHTVLPKNPQAQRLPSCEPWLTIVAPEAPIAEHAAATIQYTVTIPAAAGQQPAGEYVAAVLVDELPPHPTPLPPGERAQGEGTITILPRVAIPVYVLIAGRTGPSGRIAALVAEATQPGTTRLLLTLANDGATHLRPSGTVIVSNNRGEVVSRLPLGRTIPIFPGFQEGIPFLIPLAPGRYTAVVTVQFGAPELHQQTLAFKVTADGRVQTVR